jgi:hypothetical protein
MAEGIASGEFVEEDDAQSAHAESLPASGCGGIVMYYIVPLASTRPMVESWAARSQARCQAVMYALPAYVA